MTQSQRTDTPVTDKPSPCAIQPCTDPAHCVLFARPGEFHGVNYRPGERVLTCLKHCAQILDTCRQPNQAPPWLQPYLARLPHAKPPDHRAITAPPRPRPWQAPTRERRPRAT